MITEITFTSLQDALSAAGECHHDYELNILRGLRDEQWAGWYAAYVLGRLGNFISPTTLTNWLEETTDDMDWSASAAKYSLRKRSSDQGLKYVLPIFFIDCLPIFTLVIF